MYEQFEISGYKITTDPSFQNKRDHITPKLEWELDKIYSQIQKGNKTVIRKLLNLIERHPKNPQLKNYLSSAYAASGNRQKAIEVNNWILQEHPNYLFGLLNKAYNHIQEGEIEKVTEILGKDMELRSLYPDRDEFHLAEFTGFTKLAVVYFSETKDFNQAEIRMDMLNDIAPDHLDTETAKNHLMYKRLEAGHKRLKKDLESRIRPVVTSTYHDKQTQDKPIFNHQQIEWLYQNDSKISPGKLEEILALPRETLIDDLETLLNDIIVRYEYFRELNDEDKLEADTCFFGCHAVFLLGELGAEDALDALLETFKQDSEFLHFWYYDLLTESFWVPLLRIAKNQLEKLKEFILIPDLDCYARAQLPAMLIQLALHYPERRSEVLDWCGDVLRSFTKEKPESGIIDSEMIALMIGDIIDIQGTELLPTIEELYKLGYVSEGVVGSLNDVKMDIARKPRFDCKREIVSIFEEYDELKRYASDRNTERTEQHPGSNKTVHKTKTVVSTQKTGRNDPCPCGSGRKYKKCCLNK